VLYFIVKSAISGLLIAAVSTLARRSPAAGALVASLPLVSVLGMLWLWHDTHDPVRMRAHVAATFWYVIPSLPMFLLIPALMRMGMGFLRFVAGGVFGNCGTVSGGGAVGIRGWGSSLTRACTRSRKGVIMRRMKWTCLAMAALLAAGVSEQAVAGPNCGSPPSIYLRQLRGTTGSSVKERNDIIGTDGVACYRVFVTGPGTLTIILYSAGDNGFFRAYSSDWNIGRDSKGFVFTGTTLPGAGVGDNARRWKGPAPQGNILLVIGSKGDSRRYRLKLQLQ